jgi:serine protease AprX
VCAADLHGKQDLGDDFGSPWCSCGSTFDGFSKPELAAPGRYMLGAVPAASTMPLERPDRVVGPGYMWMSGTSFASPVVAGAAADLLALHPGWTPDQVKGALMASARALPAAAPGSVGVGEVKLDAAALVTAPPNPNLALEKFLVADPLGGSTPVFDAASWAEAARECASWDSASWGRLRGATPAGQRRRGATLVGHSIVGRCLLGRRELGRRRDALLARPFLARLTVLSRG